jgi:glyoxylase-like metal-dependent hydrolase (beta-lactamase superfamily II)
MRIKRFSAPPYGTNTYCFYDQDKKQGVLIDPTGPAEGIQSWLEGEGIAIEAALFTHAHGDHFPLPRETWFRTFPWYAHPKAIEAFQKPAINLSESIYGQAISYREIRPVEEKRILQIGPFAIRVYETPGHTAGSVCYRVGNVVFSGDTLFRGSVGRTDLPTGSMAVLMESLKKIMADLPDDTLVLPGHGEGTDIGHEKKMNPYIEEES